jgi:putative RecB family exonuclease
MSTFAIPDTLSPSRVSSFQDCPLQFRFSSIQGLPQPPGIHAVKGNVVHRALELLLTHEPERRDHTLAHESLAVARSEYEPTYDFTGLDLSEKAAAAFWRDCTALVDGYLRMEDPQTIRQAELELWVEAPLGPISIRGFIDRLEQLEDGSLMITDYKTGKAPRETDVDARMRQLEMYAYMIRAMRGELPAKMQLLYVKDGVRLVREPTEQAMRFVVTRTTALHAAIERACTSGAFPPRTSGLCNFCNFKPWCPAFGGDPDRAADEAPLMYPRPADS